MKKYLLILLACALAYCTKEKTILVPQEGQEPSWRAHESFSHNDKILLNSFASSDRLWIIGPYIFAELTTGTGCTNYVTSPIIPLTSRPTFSTDFHAYAYLEGDALEIKANTFPNTVGGYTRLALASIDSSLASASIASDYYQDPVGAFNESGQLLITVDDSSGMNACLIQVEISGTAPFQRLEVISTCRIHLARYDYSSNDIKWLRDRFLVGTTYGGYLVYPTGEIKAIFSRPIDEFFAFHDTLYALSGAELYQSADLGEMWQLYSNNFPTWYAKFFEVGGKLCFSIGSQMAEFDVSAGRIRELDNSGLETNEITSVSEFDGKVYVTTLSGLFYRDAKDFFTYKEVPTNQSPNTTAMVVQ